MESIIIYNNIQIIKKDIKNIYLKVKPTGEVILTAPLRTTNKHINSILKKREKWIDEKIEFYKANYRPQSKEFVSGESFGYLGKNYRLKVIQSDEEIVKLKSAYLQIFVKDKNNLETKKRMVDEWYLSRAKIHFQKLILKYSKIVNREVKSVKIKEMKTRWGSCNTIKGYINLNIKLIEKSPYAIEYVIFHELAHLIHPNHSKDFYNYVSSYMPDWKRRKEMLELPQ